jgi:hypothetical protein
MSTNGTRRCGSRPSPLDTPQRDIYTQCVYIRIDIPLLPHPSLLELAFDPWIAAVIQWSKDSVEGVYMHLLIGRRGVRLLADQEAGEGVPLTEITASVH